MAYKAQIGVAEESTYGTPVTVNRFFELLPGESLDRRQTVITSQGLRPGRQYGPGSTRVMTRYDAGGSVSFEVASVQFGLLFEHMLGGTGSVAQQAATTAYLHTYTPGDLTDKSLTIQKGVEKSDGTVEPFTFHGCKIGGWEFSISPDSILTLALDVDAEEVEHSTALATASFPSSQNLFHFAQGSLSVDASPVAVIRDATVSGDNPMNVDRYFLGQSGVKLQPRENEYRTLGGSLTAEFDDVATFYDLFAADTSAELVLTFTGPNIESTYDEELSITLSDVRFTGEAPKIDGPDVPEMSIPFEAFDNGSDEPITITYQTTDTAV